VEPIPDPLLLRKTCSSWNRNRDIWVCSQKLWPLDHKGVQGMTQIRKCWLSELPPCFSVERWNVLVNINCAQYTTDFVGGPEPPQSHWRINAIIRHWSTISGRTTDSVYYGPRFMCLFLPLDSWFLMCTNHGELLVHALDGILSSDPICWLSFSYQGGRYVFP
jgi:hypothetical protein